LAQLFQVYSEKIYKHLDDIGKVGVKSELVCLIQSICSAGFAVCDLGFKQFFGGTLIFL